MKKQLRTKLNQEKALEHLKLANGNVEIACNNASLSRSQFYKWLDIDEDFRAAVIAIYQNLTSYANAKLLRIEIDRDETALQKVRTIMEKKIGTMSKMTSQSSVNQCIK